MALTPRLVTYHSEDAEPAKAWCAHLWVEIKGRKTMIFFGYGASRASAVANANAWWRLQLVKRAQIDRRMKPMERLSAALEILEELLDPARTEITSEKASDVLDT
jgi:hypothetical protein